MITGQQKTMENFYRALKEGMWAREEMEGSYAYHKRIIQEEPYCCCIAERDISNLPDLPLRELYNSPDKKFFVGVKDPAENRIRWVEERPYKCPLTEIKYLKASDKFVLPETSVRSISDLELRYTTINRWYFVAFSHACWEGEGSMVEAFKDLDFVEVAGNAGAYGRIAWGDHVSRPFDLELRGLYGLIPFAYYNRRGSPTGQIAHAYLQAFIDKYLKGAKISARVGSSKERWTLECIINDPSDLEGLFDPDLVIKNIEINE